MNDTNVRVPNGFDAFGPWFNEAVEIWKNHWQPWALIALVYLAISGGGGYIVGMIADPLSGLVSLATFVLLGPGAIKAGIKSVRGQTPEINDLFSGTGFAVGALVIVLAVYVGLIACCIGVFATATLFALALPLLVDKNLSIGDALKTSFEATKQNLWFYLVYFFVLSIVAAIGAVAFVVGLLATWPIGMLGLCVAYERTFNAPAVAAAPDTQPQAPPPAPPPAAPEAPQSPAAPESPEPPAPPVE